ncbi:hypothetical protein CWI39_2360p0010 [Hamiltosporidium magnivora]|uniref:FYR N-terminal domain-containing protein n=3 Tax=Hamiltosporidium TaxID=1176354 RepID=A0A4Q9KUT2_9MICR|nr:hypothetical protein CWI39_2360p0010 [Hamiltosporidium magnivora]
MIHIVIKNNFKKNSSTPFIRHRFLNFSILLPTTMVTIQEISKFIAEKFVKNYTKKTHLYEERNELEIEIANLEVKKNAFIDILKPESISESTDKKIFPLILGTPALRMSITTLGSLPTHDHIKFHNKNTIYPIGYQCKRKYKPHNRYTKNNQDKIFYFCTVKDTDHILEISTNDGRKWTGIDLWGLFVQDFDEVTEYGNVDEFFGLNHPTVQKMIEELGDISVFVNYLPLKERKDKKQR